MKTPVKWTILFRTSGRNSKQRRKRFWSTNDFGQAKALGLSKIGNNMYEGLFQWSVYDFKKAVERARAKLLRKRLGREERALLATSRKLSRKEKKKLAELNESADEEAAFKAMDAGQEPQT